MSDPVGQTAADMIRERVRQIGEWTPDLAQPWLQDILDAVDEMERAEELLVSMNEELQRMIEDREDSDG